MPVSPNRIEICDCGKPWCEPCEMHLSECGCSSGFGQQEKRGNETWEPSSKGGKSRRWFSPLKGFLSRVVGGALLGAVSYKRWRILDCTEPDKKRHDRVYDLMMHMADSLFAVPERHVGESSDQDMEEIEDEIDDELEGRDPDHDLDIDDERDEDWSQGQQLMVLPAPSESAWKQFEAAISMGKHVEQWRDERAPRVSIFQTPAGWLLVSPGGVQALVHYGTNPRENLDKALAAMGGYAMTMSSKRAES